MSSECLEKFNDFIDTYDRIFHMKTNELPEEIVNLINAILIDKYKICFKDLIFSILTAVQYNFRNIELYIKILNQILTHYSLKFQDFLEYDDIGNFSEKMHIFVSPISGNLNNVDYDKKYYHIDNGIRYIIMNDQIDMFKEYIKAKPIDKIYFKFPILSEDFNDLISPIEECCYFGSVNIFYFLKSNFQPEITQKCLRYAFVGNNIDIINECLKYHKIDIKCLDYIIGSHNNSFFQYVIDRELFKIDSFENLDDNFIQSQNLKAAFILFNKDKNSVLPWCTAFPQLNEYLKNEKLDFSKKSRNGKTIFHYASSINNSEILKVLSNANIKKFDLNSCDQFGNSALHITANNNCKEIADFLITHGANLNQKNYLKQSPLFIAIEKKNQEIVNLLIAHGANVNEKNKLKQTALHFAAMNNWLSTSEILISKAQTLDAKDNLLETPLHICARFDRKEIAEQLLSHGAKFNEKNKSGETPLSHLCEIQ